MSSLKYQVVSCLNLLKVFGTSRHEALKRGHTDDQIFSVSTIRTYCHLNVRFVEWCRDRWGIRRLAEITPEMTTAFLSHLREQARSPATVNTYVCAIKKLEAGMRQMGWCRRQAPQLVADFEGRRADIVADPYSPEDARRLITALAQADPQYGQIARLQQISGLRVSEAVHLQADCIVPDGSAIVLQGSGIHTKGGRPRQVPILPQHRGFLVELRQQGWKHQDQHVFQNRQSLAAAVKRATSRLVDKLGIESGNGTHSLRKLYADELFRYSADPLGASDTEARSIVSQALGHNRLEVLRAYVRSRPSEDGGVARAKPDRSRQK